MNPLSIFTSLFGLAVVFGAAVMFLGHPTRTNALLAAGADTISGITKSLEGAK